MGSICQCSSRGSFFYCALHKEELTDKISKMKVHELLVMSEYFHGSVQKMVKYLRATDGSHDLTLSSPTVGFPWRNANTLVLSTFKGQMDFTFYSAGALTTLSTLLPIKRLKARSVTQ